MDLKNLLVQPDKQSSEPPHHKLPQQTLREEEPKPELRKRYSSISDLVNNEDTQIHSSSPLTHQVTSPVILKTTLPASVIHTPSTHNSGDIKVRNSISSLTNETDVDVDGKETPSIARRLSYEVSTSESNSPVVIKKTITRAASLQDMINVEEPIVFEEPVYSEEANHTHENSSTLPELLKNEPVKKENKKESVKGENENVEVQPKKETPVKQDKRPETKKPIQEKTKPLSNSKTIDEEISQLESIERSDTPASPEQSNGNKPRRYSKPPIWAQTWVPQGKARAQLTSGRGGRSGTGDLDVSFTGVRPYNDLTRRITNWVYAQIANIPKDQRQYLELEVKLGRIWHKQTDRRILVPVTNECIIDDSYMMDCYYRSGLEKEHFDRAKKFLTGLTRLHKDNFKTLRTDQIDRVYREVAGGQMPKFVRLTTDKSTNRIVANIQKINMGNLNIHSPDLLFDYRFTMSLELPNHDNPERLQKHTPENERHKKRTSFFHAKTATRIDMTDVVVKTRRNSNGSESHEMELEIDMGRLLEAFNNLDTDQFTFEELTETIADNARIINRELNKPIPK